MKGIVLAGGTGSRLWPITKSVSKQLLPIYDKPLIYYPISTLMLAGIREILIITTPDDQLAFRNLLGDGSRFGIRLVYETQEKPKGLAQAYLIAEQFLNGSSSMMVLGDNIFHGVGLGKKLSLGENFSGARIFSYQVTEPSKYGILIMDDNGKVISVIEKPESSQSRLAITGLYCFDKMAVDYAKKVKESPRGELEITSIIELYLRSGDLKVTHLTRGVAWLDTGNPNSMEDASSYIRVIEERTGLKVACLEEIAINNGWLSYDRLKSDLKTAGRGEYAQYLESLLK
jgi:glucose-1-phosphate thymidylyltransferase